MRGALAPAPSTVGTPHVALSRALLMGGRTVHGETPAKLTTTISGTIVRMAGTTGGSRGLILNRHAFK
jgi:hypothetical protein